VLEHQQPGTLEAEFHPQSCLSASNGSIGELLEHLLVHAAQSPTVRNAVLKYGSWAGFFQEHGVDIVCLQAS
jgi:hypothetical protein